MTAAQPAHQEEGKPMSAPADNLQTKEAIAAIRHAHQWLERVDTMGRPTAGRHRTGYIGLDHKLGENEDGCTLCHAVATLEGRAEPLTEEEVEQ